MTYRLFFVFLLSCCFLHCSAQVEFVSEQNGTITIRTSGTNKKVNEAMEEAEKYVFYYVFYRGIPGSSLKTGLIDIPESEAEQKFKEYFDAFYKSRYQTFITVVNQNGDVMKMKHKEKNISFDMTVNVEALRRDLEQNQVIRKFGF